MTDPNDQQNDSIHVKSPVIQGRQPAGVKGREAVRIQLPIRDARDMASSGLRTETMRVSSVSVAHVPAAEIKNPQSFVPTKGIAADSGLVPRASAERIPTLLPWILLGLSALILLIQIWTYLS